ncbi:hypothetical protein EVAR_24143_1 [Eumeta japonica]|uniref:Uncharacterized protein n=1 Tax=Eumeta variegata TaxID=151549 RepID=A0A4C1YMI1_EUMVA|nr:hypothetical protein EVAR_24143_1 [Eumeta japonica]
MQQVHLCIVITGRCADALAAFEKALEEISDTNWKLCFKNWLRHLGQAILARTRYSHSRPQVRVRAVVDELVFYRKQRIDSGSGEFTCGASRVRPAARGAPLNNEVAHVECEFYPFFSVARPLGRLLVWNLRLRRVRRGHQPSGNRAVQSDRASSVERPDAPDSPAVCKQAVGGARPPQSRICTVFKT